MPLNKNIKLLINYFLGPLVFLLLCYAVYHQLQNQKNWQESLRQVSIALRGDGQWKAWLTLALMGLNWGLEAGKWQICNRPLESISFGRAVRAVFAGLAIASFTPNRVGEYLGRVLYIEEGKRGHSVSLTLIGSMAQLLVTFFFGIGGTLGFLRWLQDPADTRQMLLRLSLPYLLAAASLGFLILLLLYFRIAALVRWAARLGAGRKFIHYVKVAQNFPNDLLLRILLLSFLRYGVFIIQYGLLFSLFGLVLSAGQLFAGITVMFLVMAIIPTVSFLTDLGLRWALGIQIMEIFTPNGMGVLAASLGIWIVNLIIPALIGSLLILRIKIFSLDEGH